MLWLRKKQILQKTLAERKVLREKKTVCNFFSLNKKVSTANKNNESDREQDDNEKEKDQSVAEEDCCLVETTDQLIDWIVSNSKAGGIIAALALIII